MIVEIDVIINQRFCFLKGGCLVSVNTLCLNNGEEVFRQAPLQTGV